MLLYQPFVDDADSNPYLIPLVYLREGKQRQWTFL